MAQGARFFFPLKSRDIGPLGVGFQGEWLHRSHLFFPFANCFLARRMTTRSIVQQALNIGSVITNGLASISAIAAGNISSAVGSIERALVSSLSVALTWLTKILGLGNLGHKIKTIIQKVKGKLDKVLDKIVVKVKGIIEKLMGKSNRSDPKNSTSTNSPNDDKKKQLDTAINAIKPKFDAMVNRNAPVKALQANLSSWQQQNALTRLWMTKPNGQFTLKAKVNPEGNVGSAYVPSDNDLRLSARQAVDKLINSAAVQARAQQFKQKAAELAQQGQLAGSASNPFQIHSGLDTLALLVYSRQTPITPERPISGLNRRPTGQSETHFDYGNGLSAQHGQWQAGTNTFVRKVGNYDEIAAMMASIRQRTRRSDALIATDIQVFIHTGKINPIYSSGEQKQLTALRHLLTYSESIRSPDNTAHSMMVLDRIAAGQTDWKTGLQDLPMHIKQAAGAKRGLELLDQKLENASPSAAAIVRNLCPVSLLLGKKKPTSPENGWKA